MRQVLQGRWTRRVAAGAAGLLAVGGVVALAGDGAGRSETARVDHDEAAAARITPAPEAVGAGTSSSDGGGGGTVGDAASIVPPPGVGGAGDGSRVVRTADLRVEVTEDGLRAAFDRAAATAAALGGFVADSSTTGGDGGGTASLTIRVPAARFDDARRRLGELGDVQQESIRGEDVSGQLVDHEARLRTLEAEERVLQELVGRARNVGEVIQVQGQLFSVRQQIEQLRAQKAHLEAAAAMSTITVALFEPGAGGVGREPADGLARSLARAVDGAEAVIGGTIVVVGYLLPVAVAGALAWVVVRVLRRRDEVPVVP